MKPAVINNNSETPTPSHHEQNNQQANNGQPNSDHSRRFPQFRQHGFGFDDPDSDVFADMGLRSRLNRMGNPFDWSARKRGGQGGNADAYDHYFDDVDFPNFGSTWDAFGRSGGKRHPTDANDRSGFFNYVPQEFRQYVPEHFGGYFRQHSGQSPYMQQQQQPPLSQQQQQQPHQQAQQPPQHHPQQQAAPSSAHHQQPPPPQPHHHQQQQQHPPTQPQSSQPSGSKSNLCDAAIQTDDSHIQNDSDNRNGMNQGNEFNNPNQYYQQPSPNPNYVGGPQYNRQYQQPYAQQYSQPHAQPQQQNRNYAHPAAAAAASASAQQHPQSAPQEGYVRNVPIVFESTGTPINRPADNTRSGSGPSPPPQQQQQQQQQQTGSGKPRPEPLNKDSFASSQPIPSDQPIPCPPPPAHNQQQPQPDQQQHSEPSNADAAPPQTPHTADCISKIQAIQRDVLELMLRVEEFGGKRGDRDYIYLDEMLTRNLLKLDTIDTNGKDSIRMARKEAIKCIQTSIAVLEAKADLHLNEKRDSIDQSSQNQGTESGGGGGDGVPEAAQAAETAVPTAEATPAEAAPPTEVNQQKSAEKIDVDQASAATNSGDGTEPQNASEEIPNVANLSIDTEPSNEPEKSATAHHEPNENKSKDTVKEKTPEIADAKK